MTELETRLVALRDELAWPATPDLAAGAAARIAAEPDRRRRWAGPPRWPRPAPALAVVLAAVSRPACCSPPPRASAPAWPTGWGSARSVSSASSACPRSVPPTTSGLGERTTLAAARRDAPVPTVTALGRPDGVYVGETDFGPSVSLVYVARAGPPPSRHGIGALLSVLPGDALALVRKLVDPSVRLRPVRVDGARGLFVEGRHVLVPPRRLAGSTLVWTTGGATYRLETELALDAALRLARSVR